MKTFFLTVFSLICFSSVAQVDSFQADIINYLNVNGTLDECDKAYNEMFTVLKRNFESKNIPDSVYEELKKDKTKSIQDGVASLSFAYRAHFTQDEINEMTAFYGSKTGQKYVYNREGLTSEDNYVVKAYFKSDVAKKVGKKQKDLVKDVSQIYEEWSRDLFKQKMRELVKGGHLN
jgi:hypothetical protein